MIKDDWLITNFSDLIHNKEAHNHLKIMCQKPRKIRQFYMSEERSNFDFSEITVLKLQLFSFESEEVIKILKSFKRVQNLEIKYNPNCEECR